MGGSGKGGTAMARSRKAICRELGRDGYRVVQFADFSGGESIQQVTVCGEPGMFPGIKLHGSRPWSERGLLEMLLTAIDDAMFEERIPDVLAAKLEKATRRAQAEGLPTFIRVDRGWERIS